MVITNVEHVEIQNDAVFNVQYISSSYLHNKQSIEQLLIDQTNDHHAFFSLSVDVPLDTSEPIGTL